MKISGRQLESACEWNRVALYIDMVITNHFICVDPVQPLIQG